MFFQHLRGEISAPSRIESEQFRRLLASATLNITTSAVYPDGERKEPMTHSIPLRTAAFGDVTHFFIRYAAGAYVDRLEGSSRYDFLGDCAIPGDFLRSGTWTFEVMASLEDSSCLFAIAITQ